MNYKIVLLFAWSIFILLLLTIPLPVGDVSGNSYADKIVHAFMFGMFSYFFTNVFAEKEGVILRKLIILSFIISTVFVVLGEYIQTFIPSRTSSLYDMFAGIFGIIIFLIFTYEKFRK